MATLGISGHALLHGNDQFQVPSQASLLQREPFPVRDQTSHAHAHNQIIILTTGTALAATFSQHQTQPSGLKPEAETETGNRMQRDLGLLMTVLAQDPISS